ncbi:hypothetical protein AVEN_198229-1 [Araneus ventricosus]|uniref:DUF4817 domain-containing protein n=1 Tax=Araneus ventricosus TaxID=182803 RepID=A0A4Y2PUF6_ARAVE|nr:hypothetical protein AVEN_198229-1 [Araneus ventricosus]
MRFVSRGTQTSRAEELHWKTTRDPVRIVESAWLAARSRLPRTPSRSDKNGITMQRDYCWNSNELVQSLNESISLVNFRDVAEVTALV